jgi:hypothetical protein
LYVLVLLVPNFRTSPENPNSAGFLSLLSGLRCLGFLGPVGSQFPLPYPLGPLSPVNVWQSCHGNGRQFDENPCNPCNCLSVCSKWRCGPDFASRVDEASAVLRLASSNRALNAQHREISESSLSAGCADSISLFKTIILPLPTPLNRGHHHIASAMLSRALRVPRALPLRARVQAPFVLASRSVTTDAASASLHNSVPQVRF